MKKIILPLLAILLLASACTKNKNGNYPHVKLNGCITKSGLNNENIVICYDQLLEDNRCPEGNTCVTQGVAKARFRFSTPVATHIIELSTHDGGPGYTQDTVVGNYTIRLVDIFPYPGRTGNARAHVEITP